MNITQEEYNTVIKGLALQLQLHRRHEDILSSVIQVQRQNIERLENENMQQLVTFSKEKARRIIQASKKSK